MSRYPRGGQWLLEACLRLPEGARGLWVPTHSPQNRSASVQVGGRDDPFGLGTGSDLGLLPEPGKSPGLPAAGAEMRAVIGAEAGPGREEAWEVQK